MGAHGRARGCCPGVPHTLRRGSVLLLLLPISPILSLLYVMLHKHWTPSKGVDTADTPTRFTCVRQPLISVLAVSASSTLPPGREHEALRELIYDSDPDLLVVHDARAGTSLPTLQSAVRAALPNHSFLDGTRLPFVLWRSGFITLVRPREFAVTDAAPLVAQLRMVACKTCIVDVSLIVSRAGHLDAALDLVKQLDESASRVAPPSAVILVSGVSAAEAPATWHAALKSRGLLDAFVAAHSPPEPTGPSDESASPPFQAGTIALRGGDAKGVIVLKRWFGRHADAPADHFPLLAVLTMAPSACSTQREALAALPQTLQPVSASGSGYGVRAGISGVQPSGGRETVPAAGGSRQGSLTQKLLFRFTTMTLNLWTTNHISRRRAAVRALLRAHAPDVLAVQEVAGLLELLSDALPTYQMVPARPQTGYGRGVGAGGDKGAASLTDKDARVAARAQRLAAERERMRLSQMDEAVYWNPEVFALVASGTAAIGEGRRMQWVRLRPLIDTAGTYPRTASTLLVCSLHLLHPDSPAEYESGSSPRVKQIRAALRELRQLSADPSEATILMGDLNDALHPRWHLRAAGLVDAFTALGVVPEATYPAHPLASWDLMYPHVPLDFVASRGGVRPLVAQVLRFSHKGESPSDHRPLVAAWELLRRVNETGGLAPVSRLSRAYDPNGASGPAQYNACASMWYYVRALQQGWHESVDRQITGADYGCPLQSLDGNRTAQSAGDAQRVCRVCGAEAVALCSSHGDRCAGFVLNSARTVATLKSSACTDAVATGNSVILKASSKCTSRGPTPRVGSQMPTPTVFEKRQISSNYQAPPTRPGAGTQAVRPSEAASALQAAATSGGASAAATTAASSSAAAMEAAQSLTLTPARLHVLCHRLSPAVAVRPGPLAGSPVSALFSGSTWQWGHVADPPVHVVNAPVVFDEDGVAGAVETPWGKGFWGSMPGQHGLLWAAFASRTHLLTVHGGMLTSFRCGDGQETKALLVSISPTSKLACPAQTGPVLGALREVAATSAVSQKTIRGQPSSFDSISSATRPAACALSWQANAWTGVVQNLSVHAHLDASGELCVTARTASQGASAQRRRVHLPCCVGLPCSSADSTLISRSIGSVRLPSDCDASLARACVQLSRHELLLVPEACDAQHNFSCTRVMLAIVNRSYSDDAKQLAEQPHAEDSYSYEAADAVNDNAAS